MGALGAEKIEFMLIGMSAAVLQGVPGTTLDVDLWINLPERRYLRAAKVALAQGATMLRNTVVVLRDETLVNFIYRVTGLAAFAEERAQAVKLSFHALEILVLPLERIRHSKLAVGRPKDLTHARQIESVLKLRGAK